MLFFRWRASRACWNLSSLKLYANKHNEIVEIVHSLKLYSNMDFENVEIVTVSKLRVYRELQNVEIVSVLKLYFVEIALFFLEGALRATV